MLVICVSTEHRKKQKTLAPFYGFCFFLPRLQINIIDISLKIKSTVGISPDKNAALRKRKEKVTKSYKSIKND